MRLGRSAIGDMVWGGICGQERTPLVIVNGNLPAHRYLDGILYPTVLPSLQQQPRGVVYQHHNASSHTYRIVQNVLGGNNVNVWDVTDCRVRQHPHPPANQQELIQALQREWLRIPRDLIRRLTFSVRAWTPGVVTHAINRICHCT